MKGFRLEEEALEARSASAVIRESCCLRNWCCWGNTKWRRHISGVRYCAKPNRGRGEGYPMLALTEQIERHCELLLI